MKNNSFRFARSLFIAAVSSVILTGAGMQTLPFTKISVRNPERNYRTDRVIAVMKSPSTASIKAMGSFAKAEASSLEKLSRDEGLSLTKTFTVDDVGSSYAVFSIDESRDSVEDAIERLQQNPDVASVQPDYIYRASLAPNDPSYGRLWGLKNTAQTATRDHGTQSLYTTSNPGTSGRDMGLETAWNKVTDCSSVIVAVIDTGVKLDHDDLKDNLWTNTSNQNGYDFINNDTDPSDDQGHGTHVAGTIGARGNNGIGTTGVCWRVKIMAVKVLDEDGSGSTAAIAAGINYARTNGAHIINMSLGGSGTDTAMTNAVVNASNAGILVVVAAGNDGRNNSSSPTYPCNTNAANLICVGAVDQSFNLAGFSNYSTNYVHIGAPGTNILSTAMNTWNPTEITAPMGPSDWETSTPARLAANGTYLQTPADWDGSTKNYVESADDYAYQVFDFTGADGAIMSMTVVGAASSGDNMYLFAADTTGTPMSVGAAPFAGFTGSTGATPIKEYMDVRGCSNTSTCSIAVNFKSDAAGNNIGYRLGAIKLDLKITSLRGLDSYNGTSMATPHVAGLAALVKAYNPNFTAADLKNAILTTGTSVTALTSRFARGSVANAPGALGFVDAPTGVTMTVQP